MASTVDRAEILRGLEILYPSDHGIIELDVLKKAGGISPGHFDNIEKLLDEIEKYDSRDDVLAIYTALNKIKPEAFKRPDHHLEVGNRVAPGLRIDAEDVSRVTGILFDLDPIRGHGDKKDSTTAEEHQVGLDAADSLKHRLSLMGWPEPVMGSSGNGATLRYLTDLPAAEETEDLLSRLLKAANSLLPAHLKGLVDVDGAMFDRPRISKVFGTMTRKGPGTPERPHRRARLISAPEMMLDPVQIDSIMRLINAGRRSDSDASESEDETPRSAPTDSRVKPLSEIENDQDIKPCLKEIILKGDILRLEEVAAHEHKGRVAIATELILAGYSDAALHEFFSRLEDYDRQITAAQIKQILSKFVEGKGGKTWLCKTFRDTEVIPAARCEGCEWVGHGQDPLIILKARVKTNPREINKPAALKVLVDLKRSDPIEYGFFIDELDISRTAKTEVRKRVEELAKAKTGDERTEEPKPDTPEDIKANALEVLVYGNPIDFVLDTLKDFHAGDRKTGELLLCTTVQGNCLNAFGTQPKLSGGSGKGKTHLCKALRHLIPKEWILYTSLSPKALWYASDIKPGMIIFSDDVRIHEEMEDTLKKSMSNFQEPSVYRVLNKDHEVEVRALPERIVWWLTSVLDDQEEQLRNRFFSGGVDESAEQDLRALDLTFAPLAEGREEFPVTENVLICREIIRIIKVDKWIVWAPFLKDGEELAVNWGNPSERRNPGRFSDLLASYAILRSGQREIIDCGNYKKVIATIEDFNSAKDLYETRAENLTTKLSDSDLHFIRWLKDKSIDNQPFQFTVNGIAGMYTGEDGKGLSPQTIERRLLGRKDRGSYGLLEKLKGGILTVEKKSISEGKLDRNKDTKKTQTTVFLQFTFNPDKFDSLGCYSSVVTLKNPQQARENPIKSQQIPKDGKDQKDHPLTPNPNKKDIKSHNREDRARFKSKGGDGGGIEDKTPNPSLSVKGGISGISGKTREPDTGMVLPMPGKNMGSDPSIIDLKADLLRAEEARKKEEHFRTPESKPDLTGISIKEIIAAGLKYGREKADLQRTEEQFSPEYLDEVLVCRQLKKALSEGITDPIDEVKTGIGPHPRRDMPIPEQNVEKEEFRALLQFLTDYRTEWPRGNGEYESISYLAGDECVAPLERAIRWRARGVAKILDVDYLLGEASA